MPARFLFSESVPGSSSSLQGGNDDEAEKEVQVDGDEPNKIPSDAACPDDAGVHVPGRTVYSVIDSPMWNFTSQSPEAPSLVAPLSDHGASPDATNDPPQVTSSSDGVPL